MALLLFVIELVKIPLCRVVSDVFYVVIIIIWVADYMIVKRFLPDVVANFFVTKSLEC